MKAQNLIPFTLALVRSATTHQMCKSTKFILFFVIVNFVFNVELKSQPLYDYSKPFIATSQLGFRVESPKEVTFYGGINFKKLPKEIPFYITKVGYRLPRNTEVPKLWKIANNVFRWPFNENLGLYSEVVRDSKYGDYLYKGVLKKTTTNWGTIWRADFSDFKLSGTFQIENEYGFTVPFQVNDAVYERLERGYLEFLNCQRSGVEIPGIRPVENADDGSLFNDSNYFMPVAGGWNDAGDFRKWLFLTLPNLDALGQIVEFGHHEFKNKAIEEMLWGNNYFMQMIRDDGRVYSDVGGGKNRLENMDEQWWNENHPGVTAAGDLNSDNIPLNGIGRHIRPEYNPLVQFQFVRHLAKASTILEAPYKNNCLVLADRAWKYGEKTGHDNRTLFIAQELAAAVELYKAGSPNIKLSRISEIGELLLSRQEMNTSGLSGYFMEANKKDGFRSIAFNSEPALALLLLVEANIHGTEIVVEKAKNSITEYVENFLLKDAKSSNPFDLPPYGIYVNPPFANDQKFRKVNNERFVRTFIHVFSENPMPHGCNQVFLEHGYLMARAGKLFGKREWQNSAEKILNWTMGHNPFGLCLFTGVGFKHPVPGNFVNYYIPYSPVVGFLGTPNDLPYLETQNLVEWSTQEIWDVPFYYAIGIISYLK